jgi:Protein of unknown function (DUF3775)
MAALPFDTTEIEELVLRFNAVMAKEANVIPDPGGNAIVDEVVVMLQEAGGDLSRDEISQEIETMNDEQKDALVALFWIGRGDAEPEEWEGPKRSPGNGMRGWSAAIFWANRRPGSSWRKVTKRCWNMGWSDRFSGRVFKALILCGIVDGVRQFQRS